MNCLRLNELNLDGQKVLMRVDFNVPMQNGTITDDSRIRASLPSIRYCLEHGAAVILMSHLGKPKEGKREPSLAPCAARLSELLGKEVKFAPDCVGKEVEETAHQLKPGEVLLLENLRFQPAEEEPELDPSFAEKLAKLADVYVNDAFGAAHRAHTSTSFIAKHFPGKAAMGFLMENETKVLSELLEEPARPFYAIIGGAKVSSKIGLIQHLLKRVDGLFIGGGMSFTFLKALGKEVGSSLIEPDSLKIAKETLEMTKSLHLPLDIVALKGSEVKVMDQLESGWEGLDIGPKTVAAWSKELGFAATIFWNGPLGKFEDPRFALGTKGIAESLAKSKAKVFVGGGDSVAAIHQIGLESKFYHLSTGGGASLEFLEFGHLPGIDALSD